MRTSSSVQGPPLQGCQGCRVLLDKRRKPLQWRELLLCRLCSRLSGGSSSDRAPWTASLPQPGNLKWNFILTSEVSRVWGRSLVQTWNKYCRGKEIDYYIQTKSFIINSRYLCLPSARSPKTAVSFETTILTSESPGYLLFGATSTLKDATNII